MSEGGFFSNLGKKMDRGMQKAQDKVDAASAKASRMAEKSALKLGDREQQFNKHFDLPADEKLFADALATNISTSLYTGVAFITKGYFCFLCNYKDAEKNQTELIPVSICFDDVIDVRLAVAIKQKAGGVAVYVPTDVPNLQKGQSYSDVLQLFTNDGNVHMFHEFALFERVFNLIMYLWCVRKGTQDELSQRVLAAAQQQDSSNSNSNSNSNSSDNDAEEGNQDAAIQDKQATAESATDSDSKNAETGVYGSQDVELEDIKVHSKGDEEGK